MKKLITIGGLFLVTVTGVFAGFGNGFTGSPAPIPVVVNLVAGVPIIAITNNVTVVGITLTTSSLSSLITFYDCNTIAAPQLGTNYVTQSYTSRAGFATNFVTTFVGYNGVTNWYTNQGYWTYNITNAASTNTLPPQASLFANNTTIASYNNNVSFQQGVSILATSNATAIIYYTPNK